MMHKKLPNLQKYSKIHCGDWCKHMDKLYIRQDGPVHKSVVEQSVGAWATLNTYQQRKGGNKGTL
jgi:hypothetical protein